MKFIIDKKVFQLIPDAIFGVVVAKGIDNTRKLDSIDELLTENIHLCEDFYEGKKVKESPEVVLYRDAMRTLGFNPNKYMCSIEALLTRISKKKGFPSINSVVDLGNAISIKHKVPMGAHDIDSTDGDFAVRPATSSDRFRPFGAGADEFDNPDEGEIIYAAGNSVRTRRWTWRQSEEGKITENVTSVMFPIDGFIANKDSILAARDELAEKLAEIFNIEPIVGVIDKDHMEFEF